MTAINAAADQSMNADLAGTARPSRRRGPIKLLLDLFSSIWLGVILLTLLFIYCSIGSSGVPTGFNILDPAVWVSVRQWRWIELTEFEWFHWWPFDLLIALICINLVVATLRRIPFNVINLGVWMIHTGIITLALGSVWYFSTKVEGDTPVVRRRIMIEVPGQPPSSMLALPGNRQVVGVGDDAYLFQVTDIDPQWELLSGDDVGKKSYKVAVMVQSKTGVFVRNLIANFPQYTEDMVRNTDPPVDGQPQPPFKRAIKAIGKPLVDEAIKLTLDYEPQKHFYLMDSHALYLREEGQSEWVQRPVRGLPRYNDRIASYEDVWPMDEREMPPLDPVRGVTLPPTEPGDPLPNVTFSISRYLRYASLVEQRRPFAEGALDPTVVVRMRTPSTSSDQLQLQALHPEESAAVEGAVRFMWVNSSAELDQLRIRREPVIRFSIPGSNVTVDEPITKTAAQNPQAPLEFKPIAGTNISYMVEAMQDQIVIGTSVRSVAIIQLRVAAQDGKPERTFKRWVFDTPDVKRDMALAEGMTGHEAEIPFDESIQTIYQPGQLPPAPILIIAGPGETDLGVLITLAAGQPRWVPAKEGDVIEIAKDVKLTVERYAARTLAETKPQIVPREQRDRDVRDMLSMIALDVPGLDGNSDTQSVWLPYHLFAFNSQDDVLRRFPYRPQTVMIGGKPIELMFSRERMALPAPVALDEFRVATHIGGFSGQTSSIMDWTSAVRFENENGGWADEKLVSVNKPTEHDGYWFFQAQWDPPDPARRQGETASRGLNYTVLGVGNRNGVHVQLIGCCIAVLGMIYAFYVKPTIKRRRQQAVYTTVQSKNLRDDMKVRPVEQPVGAAWKVES